MKEFWMVVQTYPDIPGAQPIVMGPPCFSFEDAYEEAILAHELQDDCPVVILHTVAIVESESIPSMAEALRVFGNKHEKEPK